nr:hypothetical protein [Tanacetum cinerariifolium]
MGNINVTPYKEYLMVNDVSVVPSCASSVSNDAYVLHDNVAYVPHDPLVTKLNIYKEQVAIYERARFELTLREQKMDEQMSILIRDRNQKEENLKKELHSEFKQKETKFLTDFSNLKNLKDKLENKLYSRDQSIQTVYMMLKPTELYEQDVETDIGVQNPFYLKKGKRAQSTLYDEVRAMKTVFENLKAEVDQNAIDLKSGEIERKNLLITNENLIANCIAHDVFFTVTDSAMTASRFHELSTAYTVAMNRAVELEVENSKLLEKIKNDDHDTLVKVFSKLEGKMLCVTSNDATPKVPACAKYEIDVQPIPPRQRDNKIVHHSYLNRLRDTLNTLHEIVEEARCKRPSDNNLDYACVYTKRKKHVTFTDPLETSGNNPPKIVKQQTVQKTNILILHSTRVSNATKASMSQPESNTMHDRTSLANNVPGKNVKDHHRKNKSKLSKKNRVDSSTSVRRTVLDTNSNSLCKRCNE